MVIALYGWSRFNATTDEPLVPKNPTKTDEEQIQKQESELAGMYKGEFKKEETDTGKILTLKLGDDKQATLIDDGGTTKKENIKTGTWEFSDEENRIKVILTTENGKALTDSEKLTFRYDTTAGTLDLRNYDKDVWGKNGLELSKTLDLVGTKWTWLETTLADETEIQSDAKNSFSLTFQEDNKLDLTTDCNRVQATYKTNGIETMSFSLGAMTLMYCEGSHEADFLKHLGNVESFLIEGMSLRLTLKDKAGTMTFTQDKE